MRKESGARSVTGWSVRSVTVTGTSTIADSILRFGRRDELRVCSSRGVMDTVGAWAATTAQAKANGANRRNMTELISADANCLPTYTPRVLLPPEFSRGDAGISV